MLTARRRRFRQSHHERCSLRPPHCQRFRLYMPSTRPLPQSVTSRSIEVACRCRPLLPNEITAVGTTITGGITHVPEFPNCTTSNPEVHVHAEKRIIGVPDPSGALETKKFRLHAAFGPEENDATIYSRIVAPLVDVAKNGGRAAFIAYGQTGSGKTYRRISLLQQSVRPVVHTHTQRQNKQQRPFRFSNCAERCVSICYPIGTN